MSVTTSGTGTGLWLRRFHPAPDTPAGLVCLPCAGGSAGLVCLPCAGGSAGYHHPVSGALAGRAGVSPGRP